ncbi:c-type cytochrome [bacterium]|nr:c-type cytochrome [Akkermansiaceae bacterium]MDA9337608.1 c-type cytochrome [bacterium]MDA7863582.1 c-type cytochrome [Akkermansiaceae bacterium]MDA8967174.1 c-type cytochrome [Akkermansiaceae bacterium]MDB4266250.1 c-type cytochrome [bacterium]
MFRIFLFVIALPAFAGSLRVEVLPRFEGKPLALDSVRYEGAETFSVTRLSYLLSQFAVQKEDSSWLELGDQVAYLDAGKRRNHFILKEVPEGRYRALRFSLGVPKPANHEDPAKLAADHPLNPNLNQLHWDWATGYIFMALEGRYRAGNELKGYVYHLANDNNLNRLQLAADFQVKKMTGLGLSLDVKHLLRGTRALSFEKDGASTHSHPGDAIASALVGNSQSAFAVLGVTYPPAEEPQEAVKPLFLPAKYEGYPFKTSRRFPMPLLPRDNPLLKERVSLGEKLFFDSLLSIDDTVSCAACHAPHLAFTDQIPIARGFEGRYGRRHSMPLFNLAWKSSFFWDGRAKSLREQVLKPIEDPMEMAARMSSVLRRLNSRKSYREGFEAAFGPGKVTEEKIALALENYVLTLTSYGSKFDDAMAGKAELSEAEKRGMELFFTENEPRSQQHGADCFHCHGGANFSDHQFHNNGLKPTKDLGRFEVTGAERDKFVFSTPSLRNVGLTAPYMHDGRFETLEEVVAHYNGPMHQSPSLSPNLAKHPKGGLNLSKEDQAALVAFLKTLTDPKYDRDF